jgi:predicted Zn-dependent protease
LLEHLDHPQLAEISNDMKIKAEDLGNDETVVDVYREALLRSEGQDAADEFSAAMEVPAAKREQWEIADLNDHMKKAIKPYRKKKIGYMGVANADAFSGKSNFIFGIAENKRYSSMITYRRFTADFNEEPPNPDRLVERTLKQALSSTGFMFGVRRCSDPTCARAYPHNLAEHDAKKVHLCSRCRNGLAKAFGRELP